MPAFTRLGERWRGRRATGAASLGSGADLAWSLSRSERSRNEKVIRDACKVAYLGDHEALCRVLDRYKAFVDTTDVCLSCHLMLDGYWEMWLTELLSELVRPGMVVADIGANIGYFTLLMADLVGGTGRVHAFEPNPRMIELAGKSLAINGFAERVTLHQMALGDRNGSKLLHIPPSRPMNAFLLPEGDANGIAVTLDRLDSREEWNAIELAKIDVEGAEEWIWHGMEGLLDGERLRTVILEFNAGRYAEPARFLDRIGASGFSLQRLTLEEGVVPTTRSAMLTEGAVDDVMLVLRR